MTDQVAIIEDNAQILKKLDILLACNCPFRLNLGDGDHHLSTYLFNVDKNAGIFELGCDDQAPRLHDMLLALSTILFKSTVGGIDVTFSCGTPQKLIRDNTAFFVFKVPLSLEWRNKRRHERAKIPAEVSSFCEILIPKPQEDATDDYRRHYMIATHKIRDKIFADGADHPDDFEVNLLRLTLFDVSLSGCAVLNEEKGFSYFLMPGTVYEDCKITTAERVHITANIKIVSKRNVDSRIPGEFNELCGVQFLSIKR